MKLLQVLLFGLLIGDICCWHDDDDWHDDITAEPDWFYEYKSGPSLLELIQQTALGKEITDKVSEGANSVGQYFTNVGEKLEPAMEKLARKVGEKGEEFVEQMDQHFQKTGQTLDTQAQRFAEEVQSKSIALVGSVNDELKQTAETLRVKAESFIESFGQSLQSQISSFWKSLTKAD